MPNGKVGASRREKERRRPKVRARGKGREVGERMKARCVSPASDLEQNIASHCNYSGMMATGHVDGLSIACGPVERSRLRPHCCCEQELPRLTHCGTLPSRTTITAARQPSTLPCNVFYVPWLSPLIYDVWPGKASRSDNKQAVSCCSGTLGTVSTHDPHA